MTVLNAFWDLRWFPINHEFVGWLCMAELRRRVLGMDAIRILIVPTGEGEKLAKEHVRPSAVEYWRLWNLLIPYARLMPTVKGVHVLADRADVWRYEGPSLPIVYAPDAPFAPSKDYGWQLMLPAAAMGELPSLVVPGQALANAGHWLLEHARGRRVVVVAERDDPRYPARNTNTRAWCEFLNTLDRAVYFPVVLRDASAIYRKQEKHWWFPSWDAASLNVELRAALYELAHVVMVTFGGNASAAVLNRAVRHIVVANPREGTDVDAKWFPQRGFKWGEQPPVAGPMRKWVWANDDRDAIVRAFADFEETFVEAA